MNFTSYELLKTRIDSAQLDVLVGEEGADSPILDAAISEADSIVTAYTGILPKATNHRVLVGAAGDLTIRILSGQQTQCDEHELARRVKNAENAIRMLELVRDGKITIGDADTTDQSEPVTPTVSSSPNRMSNY